MAGLHVLDLEKGPISVFVREMLGDPRLLKSLPRAIKNVDAWSNEVDKRIDAISRASVRQLSRSSRDLDLVRSVVRTLRLASTLLSERSPGLMVRIETYADLAEDYLAESRDFPVQKILKKKHVSNILDLLVAQGSVRRKELMDEIGIEEANTTRLLNAMESAGLVERQIAGRTKLISITRLGAETRPRKKRRKVSAPSIVSSAKKKISVYACTHASPSGYALTYAEQIGLTKAFNIDLEHVELEPNKVPHTQLDAIYGQRSDPQNYRVVAHTIPIDSLSARAARASTELFVLGTYVGGEVISSKEVVNQSRIDVSKGLEAKFKFLHRVASNSPSVEFRRLKGDYTADSIVQELKRFALTDVKSVHCNQYTTSSESWCQPLGAGVFEVTTIPGFDELLTERENRVKLYSFLDLEKEVRVLSDPSGTQGKSTAFVKRIADLQLEEWVNHWTLALSLDSRMWAQKDAATREIAERMYWFSSALAAMINNKKSEFAEHVVQSLNPTVRDGYCGHEYAVESVRNDLENALRIAPEDEYMLLSPNHRSQDYYWMAKPQPHSMLNPYQVHQEIWGVHRSSAVDGITAHLARRS